jgi:hypothetical protein
MTPETVGKLAKLLPLLASNQEGEVLSAARMIVRTLKAGGHDLHDLVKCIVPGQPKPQAASSTRARSSDFAEEMATEAAREAERPYTPRGRAPGWGAPPPGGGDSSARVREDERRTNEMKVHPSLNKWERDFCHNIYDQIMAGQNLTPRQRSVLNDIYSKYHR